MKTARKAKVIAVDERGRITLPPEAREGIDAFAIEMETNGILKLVPQKTVPANEADLLKSLKQSDFVFNHHCVHSSGHQKKN